MFPISLHMFTTQNPKVQLLPSFSSASADELQDLIDQNHGETEGQDQHPVVQRQGHHAEDRRQGWNVQNEEMTAWFFS